MAAKKTEKKVDKKPAAPKTTRKPRASVAEMARLELAALASRQQDLQQFLALSDKLFGGGTTKVAKPIGKVGPGRPVGSKTDGKMTLEVAFRNVLAGKAKGITIEDAVAAVQKSGYQSKAKNPTAVVQQVVHKLMQANQLVVVDKDGRKNLYALRAA